jgi:xanthine dehydrogenase accessory factor
LVVRDALVALKSVRNETRTYSFNPSGTDSYSFGAVCGGQVEVFLEVFKVPDKLIIVGAGHCGRALAQIASHLDLSITIIDDRIEYLRPEEFELPNVKSTLHLSSDFTGFPIIDSQTYIVLVSRGFDTDQAALRHVLKSPARYIGMIGSRRKRKLIFSNLKDEGFSDEELNRVHSPVGLEIGAETPEEIAISILAEIIKIRSNNRQITNNDEE